MKRCLWVALSVASLVIGGCSPQGPSPEPYNTRSDPIYYGTTDTIHDSVVSVAIISGTSGSSCSGTVVEVKQSSGYVLTAAHCVAEKDGNGDVIKPPTLVDVGDIFVIVGENSTLSTEIYPVVESSFHSLYTGDSGAGFDFAMLRAVGMISTFPTIPALTQAEDNLLVGTTVELVGYGQTESDPNNDIRYHITKPIDSLPTGYLGFDQNGTTGGICQGDSGGPAIHLLSGNERVAGVASFVSGGCTGEGFHCRVSMVQASFIQPFIDGTTGALTCEECRLAAKVGNGACATENSTCANSTDCVAYINCVNNCSDAVCVQQCKKTHSQGAAEYKALNDCVCVTACPTECGSEPMCPPPCGFSFTTQVCEDCSDNNCCTEEQQCADDPDCAICMYSSNPPASCKTNILKKHWSYCAGFSCNAECFGGSFSACGFSSSNSACQSCFEQYCCNEAKACALDDTCWLCAVSSPQPAGCDTNQLLLAFDGCIANDCAVECGVAGSGGAGGAGGAGGSTTTGGSGGGGLTGGGGGAGGSTDQGGNAGSIGVGGTSTSSSGGTTGVAGSTPVGSGTPTATEQTSSGCATAPENSRPPWAVALAFLLAALSARYRPYRRNSALY